VQLFTILTYLFTRRGGNKTQSLWKNQSIIGDSYDLMFFVLGFRNKGKLNYPVESGSEDIRNLGM